MHTFFAILVLTTASSGILGADPEPAAAGTGIKAVTIPDRKIPQPEPRGKPYPVPATKWEQRPVLWGWTCELPDGSGLAFGGIDQTADDGNPHTRVLEGGVWRPIIEELRKSNPLQDRFHQVRQLRNACKDALAKARHLYFEGKTADEEAKLLKADVDPAVEKLLKDLAALTAQLKGLAGLGEYEAGQVTFALRRIEAAAGQIKPFGPLTTPEQMAAMRRAQIELEIAGEALDAEPPPRALSQIAFEPKTKQYVIFGGEHMDYSTNDLWVFDPAKRRWSQRHPAAAPEPRFDAHLDPAGESCVAMCGGCVYEPGKHYIHVGPARWIYDIQKNTWTADGHAEQLFPADSRSARYWPPAAPEQFMKGPRPDAAANEARLKELPTNVWVQHKAPVALGARDWATWPFDPDRDMLYVYGGGHVSYAGNNVARYHLATDRWEVTDPVELPLGCIGTNEQYPSGFNYNLRPWVRMHVWNGQAYAPDLRKLILASATDPKLDPYAYSYDPDKADWVSRCRLPAGMGNSAYSAQLRHTKHGMLHWYGDQAWLLDAKTIQWKKVAVQGKMPNTAVDSCGMVYDPKRDRMLLVTLGGYARPYDGQIYALDLVTFRVAPLNPDGMNHSRAWNMFLREVAYHPESDLFLWPQRLCINGKTSPDRFPAYDAAKNRWVTLKLAMTPGYPLEGSVNSSIAWDAKRGLFWVGDPGWHWSSVFCMLRLDAAKAEIMPLADLFEDRN